MGPPCQDYCVLQAHPHPLRKKQKTLKNQRQLVTAIHSLW